MFYKKENEKLKHQLKTEEFIMTKILELVQADVDAQAANTAALAAISTKLDTLIANPPADQTALKAQLTEIQADLGDTADAVAAAGTSTTATAVAAAAAPEQTITAPSPTPGS